MGEIYKARDTKLRRIVAIKFLSADLSVDPEARRRFIQEARAASALDHPNICTIHEVDEIPKGRIFISMACYEGETLKQRLARGPISLQEAVDLIVQVGRGLAKAHASGIVHRDIKPANIMITRDGIAKILDFGLAKLSGQLGITKRKTTMGTIAYMSPEQLTGKPVDHRSDIWSVGVMLYEMLTGALPFRGEIEQAMIYSILNTSPLPASSRGAKIPDTVEAILKRCLEKDPDDRILTIDQFLNEFQQTGRGLFKKSVSHFKNIKAVKHSRRFIISRRLLVSTGFLAVFILIIIGIFIKNPFSGKPQKPMRIVPFTNYLGLEAYPSFSPDGKQLAFTSNRDSPDNSQIYIKLIGAGEPLRLTNHNGLTFGPVWSPDGKFIAYGIASIDKTIEGIWIIPLLRGTPRKIIDMEWYYLWIGCNLSWSPDGQFLAYPNKEPLSDRRSIYLYSFKTGQSRKCTSPPDHYIGDLHVVFSHDGSKLAFMRQQSFYKGNIFTLSLKEWVEKQLTFDNCGIETLAWGRNDHEIFFTSDRAGSQELWKINATGGHLERVPINGVGKFIAISSKGDQFAFSTLYKNWPKIYRADYPASGIRKVQPYAVVESTRRDWQADISPDGKKIAFNSNRSENDQIWMCDSNGKNLIQLTRGPQNIAGSPRWSPDGRLIAYDARPSGSCDIFLVKPNGDSTTVCVGSPAEDAIPTWSRDGRSIYFASNRTGKYQIWKKTLGMDDPVQITRDGGLIAFESFDGRSIYYMKLGPPGIWKATVTGEHPKLILDKKGWYGSWALCKDGIYFINDGPNGSFPIYFYSFKNKNIIKLADLGNDRIMYLTVSPDRSYFLYSNNSCDDTDIYLVENFE